MRVSSRKCRFLTSTCSSVLLLLLVLSALALPGCTRRGSDADPAEHPLPAGEWSGDVAPAGGAPFGALFHVAHSDSGPTIRLESQYVQQQFTDVAISSDSLRFIWPMATPRHCLLLRRDDLAWQGDCLGGSSSPIGVLLVPPVRSETPTGVARAAYESDIPWVEERAGQLRILVQAGGTAAPHAAALRAGAVVAFENAFALLNETPPDIPFWFIYLDSRAAMQRLIGTSAGGWADGVARAALHAVNNEGRAPDRHEIMHVAATAVWGVPAAPWEWMHEGLATYAAGECAGALPHNLAAALSAGSSAVPLHRLVHNFRESDEVSAYLNAASVVGYIRERFGIGAVRSLWQEGIAALPIVTGMDLAALEQDWRAFIATVPPATSALATVRERGCL